MRETEDAYDPTKENANAANKAEPPDRCKVCALKCWVKPAQTPPSAIPRGGWP